MRRCWSRFGLDRFGVLSYHLSTMIELGSVVEKFRDVFGSTDGLVVGRAPGRVNLIGEHTDYNEGFVLPMAIERDVVLVGRAVRGGTVRAFSMDFDQTGEFRLDELRRTDDVPWLNYPKGVAKFLQEGGVEVPGFEVIICGDVPIGGGLSSSAAFEVAAAAFMLTLAGRQMAPVELAKLARRAENEFVGVQCGIMDQFISTLAREGSALFLDCRDLSYSHVPLDPSARIVVCDTRVQRSLDVSAYNRRRAECEKAVAILNEKLGGKKALRDVSVEELEDCRDLLPEVLFNRVHHVVHENNRVLTAVEALRKGEISRFGILLYESHYSLKKRYEVSCRELDILVELAAGTKGTIGARMTGAGFGGCTVNLVEADAVPDFCKTVSEGYRGKTGIEAAIYACQPSEGVRYQWLQAAK